MKVANRIPAAGAIAVNASSICWSVTSNGVEVNVSMMLIGVISNRLLPLMFQI